MYNGIKRAVWIRDAFGHERYFADTADAAKYCDVSKQVVYNACSHGIIIAKKWQATRVQGDWSKCNKFDTVSGGNIVTKEKDIMKRAKRIVEERKKPANVEQPKIKEPKTEEDWEAMRQRAMQPFQMSRTDEEFAQREQEMRDGYIRCFKETFYTLSKPLPKLENQ